MVKTKFASYGLGFLLAGIICAPKPTSSQVTLSASAPIQISVNRNTPALVALRYLLGKAQPSTLSRQTVALERKAEPAPKQIVLSEVKLFKPRAQGQDSIAAATPSRAVPVLAVSSDFEHRYFETKETDHKVWIRRPTSSEIVAERAVAAAPVAPVQTTEVLGTGKVLTASQSPAPEAARNPSAPRRIVETRSPTELPDNSGTPRRTSSLMGLSPFAEETQLTGTVEVRGGLAITGSETHLRVYRWANNMRQEVAALRMDTGEFSILVGSKSGALVGEIVDGRGRVLGRGELEINHSSQEKAIRLLINPLSEKFPFKASSVESSDFKEVEVPSEADLVGVRPVLRGQRSEADFTPSSSAIIRAEFKDYVPTNQWALAQAVSNIPMYPSDVSNTVMELAANKGQRISSEFSVIMGQVSLDGKPLQGAQVEIAENPESRVVYFSGIFPNPDLISTADNGKFMIVTPGPGMFSIRVRYGTMKLPAQIINAFLQQITSVKFAFESTNKIEMKVFNPFDPKKGVMASVFVHGIDNEFETSEDGRLVSYLPMTEGLSLVEVDAGPDFAYMRAGANRYSKYLRIPTISYSKLSSIESQAGFNHNTGTSEIIGFFEDSSEIHDVQLANLEGFKVGSVAYFDHSGSVVRDLSSGQKIFGFLINDVPLGTYNLIVKKAKSKTMYSEYLVADPSYLGSVIVPAEESF